MLLKALTLALMSATSISLFDFRVSDFFSLVILFLLLSQIYSQKYIEYTNISISISVMLLWVIVRTAIYLLDGNPQYDHDTFIVPGAIFIGLLCSCVGPRFDWLKLSTLYCIVFLCLFGVGYVVFLPAEVLSSFGTARNPFLSINPNQFSLYLYPIPFFLLNSYFNGQIGRASLLTGLLIAIFLLVACVAKSLAVSYFVSALLAISIKILRESKAIALIIAFVLIVIFTYLSFPVFISLYSGDFVGSQAGQGDIRITLWSNGILAWLDSFLFGHGPGHYSGNILPYENYEAHNTFIDFAAAYGIFGLLTFFVLVWLVLNEAIESGSYIMCAAIISLVIQIIFHFYARQPIFWIWIVAVYSLAKLNRNKLCKT